MKIVFLVAGSGSRLNLPGPKPLTSLSNGETLLGRQLRLISESPILSKAEIYLVVGHECESFRAIYPHIKSVFNSKFSQTNTAKSLLAGLEEIENESILWFNGDLFYDKSIVQFIEKSVTNDENVVLYKASQLLLDDEAMKLEIRRSSSTAIVSQISKDLHFSKLEAIGINYVSAESLSVFKSALYDVAEKSYFEEAIEFSIKAKLLSFSAMSVGEGFITEVDFKEDLERVESYIEKKKSVD
jgi:L-glutamine-phosphate cytidylyltransferase